MHRPWLAAVVALACAPPAPSPARPLPKLAERADLDPPVGAEAHTVAPPAGSAAPGENASASLDAGPRAGVDAAPAPWPPRSPPERSADWCTGDFRALNDDACFFLPDSPTDELVLYLHGIVPPSGESVQKTTLARVVTSASRRANVAALLPRGEQGYGPKGLTDWWSWPTSRALHVARGRPFVEKLVAKRRELEAASGVAFRRLYVAGSSAGAWFAAGIALHGNLDADGFGAFSGGAGYVTPALASLAPRPFYVGFGAYDSVGDGARGLVKILERAGWPVRVAEHATGHGSREIYLDEAIAFWREHSR